MFEYLLYRRYAGPIILVFWLFGGGGASAQSCTVFGPRYNLIGDTVGWAMKIGSGSSCVRGVRFSNVEFQSLELVSPPRSGQIALQGSGFRYAAKADFRGEDSFSLEVLGAIYKTRGSSTIHVTVSVIGPPDKLATGVTTPPSVSLTARLGGTTVSGSFVPPVAISMLPQLPSPLIETDMAGYGGTCRGSLAANDSEQSPI
jgi:hypothetical protein